MSVEKAREVPPSAPEIVWLFGALAERGLAAGLDTPPSSGGTSGSSSGGGGGGGASAPPSSGGGNDGPAGKPAPALPDDAAARDSLRAYLRYVAGQPRMTREEETAAGKRIEEGENVVIEALLHSPLAAQEIPELATRDSEPSTEEIERISLRLAVVEKAVERAESELRDLARQRRVRPATLAMEGADEELALVLGRRGRSLATVEAQVGMSIEAIRELGRTVRRGERQAARAKADLVQAHLRQVVWIARRYAERGVPLLDLIQEGNIGLMTAANKFDYRLGHRFATYAAWWIRQSVSRALGEQARTIRLPVHTNEALARLNRSRRRLTQRLQREPTPAEIAVDLAVPIERVEAIMQWARSIVSLDTPVGEEDSGVLEDLVPNPNAELPSAAAMASELSARTRAEMAALSPREQEILAMRFGIGRDHEMTLEEIGERFGLTRERIRQIEARALSKLRHPARARALKGFVES